MSLKDSKSTEAQHIHNSYSAPLKGGLAPHPHLQTESRNRSTRPPPPPLRQNYLLLPFVLFHCGFRRGIATETSACSCVNVEMPPSADNGDAPAASISLATPELAAASWTLCLPARLLRWQQLLPGSVTTTSRTTGYGVLKLMTNYSFCRKVRECSQWSLSNPTGAGSFQVGPLCF